MHMAKHMTAADLEHSGADAAQHLRPCHDALLVLASPEGTVGWVHCHGCSIGGPQLDAVLNATGCQNRQGGMALQHAQHVGPQFWLETVDGDDIQH